MKKMNLEMIQWLDIHWDMNPNIRDFHNDFRNVFELDRHEADVMLHAWEQIEDHRDWSNVDFSKKSDVNFDWGS